MSNSSANKADPPDATREGLLQLLDQRRGPYNSFNPVSRTQVWQWCSAMGDHSPLYLDDDYRKGTEFADTGVVAPPAMMQMWTMRDINMKWAPDSCDDHPYPVMEELEALGFTNNVAVSYDIKFHRYLVEGDRAHHYNSVVKLSERKSTGLGEGYFFTDCMECLDQNGELFAEALITYFQYRERAPAYSGEEGNSAVTKDTQQPEVSDWQPVYKDLAATQLKEGDALPQQLTPITHKLIVGGAIATQDYIPTHHNAPAARAASMPDIFMNILTTCGLSARYLSDWAGPGARLQRLQFNLLAPNTPGDTMVLEGQVKGIDGSDVDVEFAGHNSMGHHVTGAATLSLAG